MRFKSIQTLKILKYLISKKKKRSKFDLSITICLSFFNFRDIFLASESIKRVVCITSSGLWRRCHAEALWGLGCDDRKRRGCHIAVIQRVYLKEASAPSAFSFNYAFFSAFRGSWEDERLSLYWSSRAQVLSIRIQRRVRAYFQFLCS